MMVKLLLSLDSFDHLGNFDEFQRDLRRKFYLAGFDLLHFFLQFLIFFFQILNSYFLSGPIDVNLDQLSHLGYSKYPLFLHNRIRVIVVLAFCLKFFCLINLEHIIIFGTLKIIFQVSLDLFQIRDRADDIRDAKVNSLIYSLYLMLQFPMHFLIRLKLLQTHTLHFFRSLHLTGLSTMPSQRLQMTAHKQDKPRYDLRNIIPLALVILENIIFERICDLLLAVTIDQTLLRVGPVHLLKFK